KYNPDWSSCFPVKKSRLSDEYLFCLVCSEDICIGNSGVNDLKKHLETSKHISRAAASKTQQTLMVFFRAAQQTFAKKVTNAEVLFCQAIAEHGLPIVFADHFTKPVKLMFPDPSIAKTKATAIIKALANHHSESVVMHAKMGPGTLMVDESNDVCSNKEVCIMIRYFHQILKVVKTDLLSMLTCNTANADNLFSAINSVFVAHHIPWENVISFSSDSASVMIGKNNSVLSWIKQQSNSVYSLPCVFHISHLAAKDAVKAIPKPVEDLLVDIFYYFTGSDYQQYQQWCDADELQLIKHGGTRWLSLCQAVAGYNNQWEPLKAYFGSSSQIEHPGRVQRINTYMQDEEMHLYFLFLEHGLDDLITYNMFFQAEDSRVVYLWEESVKLLKTLLNQFVKSDV
uniref:Uncharacterized protein n=1 Tax=Latimeria chalumnae TaxID=7897 RepID=H2ZYZ4_LATCH